MMPTIISDKDTNIYQLSIVYEGMTINFRDSMKILPMSLKSVGQNMLGGRAGKLGIHHDTMRIIMALPNTELGKELVD